MIQCKVLVSGLVFVGAFLAIPATSIVHATSIVYGDFSDFGGGGTVSYLAVTESSITDPLPLYDTPSISVNTLDFDPSAGFLATSSGGGIDLTDGQLNFGVLAVPGTAIGWLTISESGLYTLTGAGTAATSVSVATPITVDILEVDGVPLAEKISLSIKFEQEYTLDVNAGLDVPWDDSVQFDIQQALIDDGTSFVLGATKIDVVLDNVLLAFSEAGTIATISKEDIIISTVVPEPGAIALVGLSGLLVGGCSLRRRRLHKAAISQASS